ncbi:glycosyl transferase [Gloeothece citriformis]|uniref:glycosyl transferase n=1 Tax=Gloeothece citriformis TaxID=2546356 RepID=UPI00059CE0AC|nr:glycosyl transferase [Gloeothece citriformis]
MTRPTLYLAVTNHGFGHAVRISCVAERLKQLYPDILLILSTTAPRWLLESYIQGDFIYRPRAFDVGVVQSDSLNMDKKATLEKLQDIRSRQNAIIAGEVNFIKTNRVNLILADIPPLAAPIAKAANIPCWMMSNFGWDLIYQDWGEEFREIADWMRDCYRQCDRLFRLPLCEPMSAFNQITDVGLTGGNPRYSEAELRELFKIKTPPEKTVLLTFGGLGLQQIPYHNLSQFSDWQFITFDRQAPDLPNLIKITDRQYRPVDLMPICGRIVSKPGYSTFAEALRLDLPIISLTRHDFPEAEFLLSGIQNYSSHKIITPEEFFQGNWESLISPLTPPHQPNSLPKNGTEVIAQEILNYLLK